MFYIISVVLSLLILIVLASLFVKSNSLFMWVQKLFVLVSIFSLISLGYTKIALIFTVFATFVVFLSYIVFKAEGYRKNLQERKYRNNLRPLLIFVVLSAFIIFSLMNSVDSTISIVSLVEDKNEFIIMFIFFALFSSRVREAIK